MPTFTVTSPDGKKYQVNAPEGATKEDAIAYIQAQQQKEQPFSIAETIKNIPSSGYEQFKNLAQVVTSPLQTAQSVLDLGAGALQKAAPQSVLNFVERFDPNPQAAKRAINVAENVGQMYKDRYGGTSNILNTIQNDPVGVLGDVAGVLTGGASLAPKAGAVGNIAQRIGNIGSAIDPLNLGINAAGYAASKALPSTLPANLYESAAKFPTSLEPDVRARITETALREQLPPTSAGVGKATIIQDELMTSVNNLIDEATASGARIPTQDVFKFLNELKTDVGGFKMEAPQDLAEINRTISNFKKYLRNKKIKEVTPQELNAFKSDLYNKINYKRSQLSSTPTEEKLFKNMARAAKESVESVADVKDLNARYGQIAELMPYLQRSAARIENRDFAGIGPSIKAEGGRALAGDVGAIIGGAQGFFDAPKVKARAALNLYKRQNQGINQFMDNNPNATLARQLLNEIGSYQNYGILNNNQPNTLMIDPITVRPEDIEQ